MDKLSLQKIARDVRVTLSKHSPGILTGIGIAGMVTSTILAVKATPKALHLIEDAAFDTDRLPSELTAKEVVKACWKCYIPSAATGLASAGCLIGASTVSARRNAALAAAYTLSDNAFRDYREKVIESIGEKKERVVHDKISEQKIKDNPVENKEVIMVDKGESLFFEPLSSRYFKSSINKIKATQNDLNEKILCDPFNSGVSLNDFYREIGLLPTAMGDNMGWNLESGKIDVYISPQLISDGSQYDGEPCLVLNYRTPPRYDF